MNWAASYLTNDFYRAYIRRDAPDSQYVLMGRVATTVILLLGVGVSLILQEISKAMGAAGGAKRGHRHRVCVGVAVVAGWAGGAFLIYGGLFALGGLLSWQSSWLWEGLATFMVGMVGVRYGLQATWRQSAEAVEVLWRS